MGASLSVAAGALDRRFFAGRLRRHSCAANCAMALGAAWPAIHYREPARGRHQYSPASGSQFAARWLHSSLHFKLQREQRDTLRVTSFRSSARLIPIAAFSRGTLVLEVNPLVPV